MAQKKAEKETKATTKRTSATTKQWKKPRITRHGNMRQLTQMSG
jgi:hypothetical protein